MSKFQGNYTEETKRAMRQIYKQLSERDRRMYAAAEVMKLGYGGQKYICAILGCSAGTVRAGRKDLLSQEATPLAPGRIRRSGGGREKIVVKITNIDEVFETILQEHTAGSPMDEQIKWTDMTQKEIMEAFHRKGYTAVTKHVVRQLLKKHGYVKRKMRKSKTVKEAAHRDEQFQQIHKYKEEYIENGNPVMSMDVKKKENIGEFFQKGEGYGTKALPVLDHDFADRKAGTIVPHGIYDIQTHIGYMTLSLSRDTSEFACACVQAWWQTYGREQYPHATSILLLVDGGGSNSSRAYLFKEDLQKLANALRIDIRIAHYPPYTSKFNPIEHKLFCHVARAFSRSVITSIEKAKKLIEEKTKTKSGLQVFVSISDKIYKTGRKACATCLKEVTTLADSFLGSWNYRAIPQL
jgi:hypothetical protein